MLCHTLFDTMKSGFRQFPLHARAMRRIQLLGCHPGYFRQEDTIMSQKKLDNVSLGMTWTSYAAAAFGVLRGKGWYQNDLWQFMGDTGAAFHFFLHKSACPSSVTVYDWGRAHVGMLDRIGVASEHVWIENHLALNTAALLRETSVQRIRQAIDDGFGVIVWAPTPTLEFGLINGYDDTDGVFLVEACDGANPADPLLYGNLGVSEVPCLCYQIPLAKLAIEPDKTIASSLQYGLELWNETFHIHPDYGSGRKAFENLFTMLRTGDINPFGLGYVLAVYHDSRVNLAKYLAHVNTSSGFAGKLPMAAAHFEKTATLFGQMSDLVPFNLTGSGFDAQHLSQLALYAEEAYALEDGAFAEIARVLGQETHT